MSANTTPRIGLALTGGGAKGAYHVGALRAIAELGVPIHAVSGASIGALNGAIVATAGNMQQAHKNLDAIWKALGEDDVIAMSGKAPAYLGMLLGMGAAFRAMPVLTAGVTVASRVADYLGVDIPNLNPHLLDDTHLVKLLQECTTPKAMKNGLPFYVSVFETSGGLEDVLGVLRSVVRLGNTADSEFLHIQSLPESEMQEALMASAALPVLFKAREVQGKFYTDGGQGDWYGVGGNTPVKPLVDAGCDTVIVVHLCDGSAWNRNQYPNTNIIEVRPQSSLAIGNAVSDVLGFDTARIAKWSEQGYADSMHCLKRVFDTIRHVNEMETSRTRLEQSLQSGSDSEKSLEDAMKRIF
jgi:NTE family protein